MSSGTRRDTAFGDWLRATLAEVDRRPDQLARHLGVDPARVNRWLTGREQPTPEQCERLATAVGIPARTVLTRAGLRPGATRLTALPAADPAPVRARPERSAAMVPPDEPLVAPTPAAPAPETPAPSEAATDESATGAATPAPTDTPPRPRRSARRALPPLPAPPPAPPPIPPAPSAERIAALRALADDLDGVIVAYGHLQAERDRLDQECSRLGAENARLTEENARLQAWVDRVRSALDLPPTGRQP